MSQQALHEETNEELYRTILNSSPDWLEWLSADHRNYFVSSAVVQITGYSPEEFTKNRGLALEITHPDDRETIAHHRQEILSHTAGDCEFEYRIIHRRGELRWIHHQCHSILKDGKWIGHHATNRDITARKNQEEELESSSNTIKALMNAPMDGMMLIAPDGTVNAINPVMAQGFGLPAEQIIGRSTYELFPPEMAEFRREMIRKTIETGLPTRFESRGIVGDVDVTIYPVPDQKGNIFQLAITARDISERKKREQELHTSHKMISTLMNAPTDVILFLDLDGKVLLANQNLFDSLKLAPEKIIGQDLFAFLPPQLARDRLEKFDQVLKTSQPVRFEDRGVSGIIDNIVFPILDDDGSVIQVAVLGRDISDRKHAEDELRQSKKELEVVLDHHKDAIGVFNREHELIYVNPAGVQMTHFSSGKALIEHYQQTNQIGVLDKSGNPADFSTILNRHFLQRTPVEYEIILRTPSHSEDRFVNMQFVPVPDEMGDPQLIIFIARDITESRKAEAQIMVYQTELEERIAERTTELNQANRELRERILQSEHATTHAEALARVAAHTSVLSELPAFLQMVCDETIRTVNYDFSSIISYDEKTDAFFLAALSPLIELPRQYPVYSRTVLEKYIRDYGPTIVIPDISALPDYKGLDLLLLFGVRTLIIIPMIANGEIFGTLNVASVNAVRVPDASEINLLKALTDQATIGFTKARLFEQISESRVRLQTLSEKLVEIQEQEKRNLASELHDEIGQSLTSLHLNLGIISRMMPDASNNRQDLQEHLERANQTTVRLLERVREISLDLRPAMLDDLGLIPALLAFFERYNAQTQIQVLLKHSGVERRFTPKVETAVFRIIQEALTNVARHTQSTQITVRLWADSNYLRLQVEDDGGGFNPQQAMQQGLTSGLSGMAERAASCGGSLDIESEPGQGTCLSAEFAL